MKRMLCLALSLVFALGICFSAPVTITASATEVDTGSGIIDATAMTTDELQTAVTEQLNAGNTAITVKLAEDADVTMFSAITAPLAATVDPSLDQQELVNNHQGTIDLTISGATTVPEKAFDAYYGKNPEASAVLRSVTLTDATEIGEFAFFACGNLIGFSAPNAITISDFVFEDCVKLAEVYLPSVQTLGDATFRSCYALKTISLPECIDLGGSTFVWCEALETVYAPKVTNLGALDFMLCTSLTKVTLGSVVSVNQYYESIDNGLFSEANDTRNIELILACNQKALSFDSSTKYWNADEEAFNFGNTSQFIGCTFKSVTLAHTPEADDGDCTTSVHCSACHEIVVEAKESHDWSNNDLICAVCGKNYFSDAKVLSEKDGYLYVDGEKVTASSSGAYQYLPTGKYKLGENATLSSCTVVIKAGEQVEIDLNGYKWSFKGYNNLTLEGELSLYDLSENKTGKIVAETHGGTVGVQKENAVFNLYGGTLESTVTNGFAIRATYGQINLYGGALKGAGYAMEYSSEFTSVKLVDAVLESGEGYAQLYGHPNSYRATLLKLLMCPNIQVIL